MYILGVYYGHNATASLMRDGTVVASVSEERFNGIKNFHGFPKQAIEFVLKSAKIDAKELDAVTIPLKYSAPIHTFRGIKRDSHMKVFIILYTPVLLIRKAWGILSFSLPILSPLGVILNRLIGRVVGQLTNKRERNKIAAYLGIENKKVKGYDHHLSHAASSYYSSPFNKKQALVFTLDGEGDFCSGSVSIFENDLYQVVSKIPRESSLGNLYTYLTMYLGMKSGEHEYKVMGLAPYAKKEDVDRLYKKIEDIVQINPSTLRIRTTFNTMNTEQFLKTKMSRVRFDLLAGVFQKLIEEKITEWVRQAIKKTGIHTVILGGGVFMNVKVNQKIGALPEVNELFVIPSCGDESSILGSSYLAYIEACKRNKNDLYISPIQTVYWGPEYSDKDIESFIRQKRWRAKYFIGKVDDIEKEIADLLSKGLVVARFNGGMEFGARALGNRSILADPRNRDHIKIINEQMKNRDFWMPFAPSILYEKQHRYIVNPKNFGAYYMMMTFNTTEKAKKDLIAAMHPYDDTVRPQLVRKEDNESYYKIIKEFERITGVSGILNTSFNLHGYPIVLGPKEALYAFEHSGISVLAMGSYLIRKKLIA